MRGAFVNELVKLAAQTRLRAILVLVLAGPWVFLAVLVRQQQLPTETLYGRYLTTTGFAMPMVVLVISAQWVFPVFASLAAGTSFSGEDAHGTWKMLLTRSAGRGSLFTAKVIAAALVTVLLVALEAASSLLAGLVLVGDEPFVDLGSEPVGTGRALALVLLAWLTVLPPVLGFSALAVCVSVLSRSSVLGVVVPVVVGLLCQVTNFVDGGGALRRLLPTAPMSAWRGLLDSPSYTGPLVQGLVVSVAYVVVLLGVAYAVFSRRDVADR